MKKYFLTFAIFITVNITFSQKLLSEKDVSKDVDYLVNVLTNVHPNCFKNCDEKDFYLNIERTKESFNYPVTLREFYLKIAPVFNLLQGGHSQLEIPIIKQKKDFVFFPLKLKLIDNVVFITDDYNTEITKKMELLSINGEDINFLIDTLITYIDGEDDEFKKEVLIRDNAGFSLLLNIVFPKIDEIKIKIKNHSNNKQFEYIIDNEYKSITNKEKPLYFNIINDIGYLHINKFVNNNKNKYFIDSVFNILKIRNIENLIIDIRDSPGGNSRVGDYILKYISNIPFCQFSKAFINNNKLSKKSYKKSWSFYTKIFPISIMFRLDSISNRYIVANNQNSVVYPFDSSRVYRGNVYILTSHYTYSSAISFVRTIKDNKIGTVVGQETVWANLFGPAESFQLPKSKLIFTLSNIQQIRLSGAISERGVIPDYNIKANIKDFLNDVDTELIFTIDIINNL